ncbi:MAG: hypothetical protein LBK71_05760 [Verrucomicrobiales bacterium]|jgi:hypothetical protein|nr:hypothetical protein [Verrucomicrobiales bacterium]
MRLFIYLGISLLALTFWTVKADEAPEREPWDLPVQPDARLQIGKIYDFLNDAKYTPTGNDPVLQGEFRYFNYGAVTKAQREARKGHYYIVSFSNDGPPADITIRMDFRQLLSRDKVNTLAVLFKDAQGDYQQQFVVAGELYRAYGDVNSWRIAVVKDGKIVAQKKSYVW